jgi:uncharacterized membrane protein
MGYFTPARTFSWCLASRYSGALRGGATSAGPTKLLTGTILLGFGIFNLVEGTINHHLLGIHHVNETVPRGQWVYWDLGFLAWGAVMLVVGWMLLRTGQATSQVSDERLP